MALTDILLFGACSALLNMGAKMTPAGHWRAYKRRGDGVEYIGGHGQEKARPRKAQGGRWLYSRFFCKLPDHHDREKDNKQDNQAGATSSRI